MDDETRQALMQMEDRLMRVFSNGAYALHERMASLEAAALSLREQIERLVDHVEDTAITQSRDRMGQGPR